MSPCAGKESGAAGCCAHTAVSDLYRGTTSTTVRQRAVPQRLLGRVTSVYLLGAIGGSAVGTLLGGAIGQRFAVVAPYWFGFVGSAVLTVAVWRSLTHIVHAAEDVAT